MPFLFVHHRQLGYLLSCQGYRTRGLTFSQRRWSVKTAIACQLTFFFIYLTIIIFLFDILVCVNRTTYMTIGLNPMIHHFDWLTLFAMANISSVFVLFNIPSILIYIIFTHRPTQLYTKWTTGRQVFKQAMN